MPISDDRSILQAAIDKDGHLKPGSLNEVLRQIQESTAALEGRLGPIALRDSVGINGTLSLLEQDTQEGEEGTGVIYFDTDLGIFRVSEDGGPMRPLISSPKAIVLVIGDITGSAISTGVKGYIPVPFDCTISGWVLLGDAVGSIVIDVWKDTYANYPPTVADTIAGSEKPTLAGVNKNQDVSLTTWTTTVTSGDVLGFNVDSAATVKQVTLSILVEV